MATLNYRPSEEAILWMDIEADAFGISRVHEYVFKLSEYTYTYLSRLDFCIADLTELIDRISGYAPNHEVVLCLGHHSNFRYGIFPQYKNSRRGIQKAACYGDLRKYLQRRYSTAVLANVEADDVLGVMYQDGDLLYSPDKDLRTIAGDHLLPDGDVITVSQLEADRAFYKQVITGDATDGYPGIPLCGAKHKMFESEEWLTCSTEREFWLFVQKQYALYAGRIKAKYGDADPLQMALQMARCARILRSGEYDFDNERPVLWRGPG